MEIFFLKNIHRYPWRTLVEAWIVLSPQILWDSQWSTKAILNSSSAVFARVHIKSMGQPMTETSSKPKHPSNKQKVFTRGNVLRSQFFLSYGMTVKKRLKLHDDLARGILGVSNALAKFGEMRKNSHRVFTIEISDFSTSMAFCSPAGPVDS